MILALYLLIPLLSAIILFLFKKECLLRRYLALGTSFFHLILTLSFFQNLSEKKVVVFNVGNLGHFGIVFAIDSFSHIMLLSTSFIFFIFYLYNLNGLPEDFEYEESGFYSFTLILLTGITGAFSTGDLFNLYVWFEVILTTSFILMILGNKKKRYFGAFSYVIINLISSTFFLTSLGLLYGKTGTLNIADLAIKLDGHHHAPLILTSAALLGSSFAIKSALFPFFFWLPDSYHLPTKTITTLFGGILTKIGIYALIRCFILFFHNDAEFFTTIFSVSAALTMVLGVMGAIAQKSMKEIFSFHIISQMGYLALGLALFTRSSFAAIIFFMVHIMFTKTGLFLTSNYVERKYGSDLLAQAKGILKDDKFISLAFLIFAFSIAGFPPFSGFFGKVWIFEELIKERSFWLLSFGVIVSFFTFFSMMKIWRYSYMEPSVGTSKTVKEITLNKHLAIALCLVVVLGLGLFVDPITSYIKGVGIELFNYKVYTEAVMSHKG